MVTLSLPDGYTMRPLAREDAEGMIALLGANAAAMGDPLENTLEDVLREMADPDLNLAHDTRAVFTPDGRLIAYSVAWATGRPALPIVEVFLHSSEWETDTVTERVLLDWAEDRVRENLASLPPDMRVAMQAFSDVRETRYLAILADAGFRSIRHSFQMGITFDSPPEPPRWPEGFTLHVAQEDDVVPVFDALRDAWRDHFGYIEEPYDERLAAWRHHWQETFAPGLWFTGMAGDTVAGLCLCDPSFGGDEGTGFVSILGVRRAYRRRGLAEALLRHAFVTLYAAGRRSVLLYVDGESPTGATRLYERAGMTARKRFTRVEKELRPGIDPSALVADPAS